MTFKWPRLCCRARQAARATISPPVAFSPFKGEEGVCMSRSKSRQLLALVATLTMLAVVTPGVVGANAAPQKSSDPVGVAVGFIQDNTADYGVSATDVSNLRVLSSYKSAHNGVTHVNLNQRRDGLEVFDGYATVNIKNGVVLFVGESLVAGLDDA